MCVLFRIQFDVKLTEGTVRQSMSSEKKVISCARVIGVGELPDLGLCHRK